MTPNREAVLTSAEVKATFSEGTVRALKRMCKIVRADYESVDFGSNYWYTTHTWTRTQEKEFLRWLTKALIKSLSFRKDLLAGHLWHNPPRKLVKKAADFFVFMYGWSYKKKKEEVSPNGTPTKR